MKLYICNGAGAKWCPLCSRGKEHPKLPGCGSNDCEFATDGKAHLVKCIPIRPKPDPLGRGLAKRLHYAYWESADYEDVGKLHLRGTAKTNWQAVAREVRRIVKEVGK